MVDGADRARLNQAWNDLFGSWPYHDAYLGMLADHYGLTLKSRDIQDLDAARDRGAAGRGAAVRDVAARALRRGDEGAGARPARPRRRCAGVREPRVAPAADARREDEPARVLSEVAHGQPSRSRRARFARCSRASWCRRPSSIASRRSRRGPEKPLNDWEMASRMSFFLWSSIPDDELRRAAGAGELSNPAMLAQQVKRMTADPKARRLATEFFGQWLGFYHFDEYRGVDTSRFPEFTDEVKSAMYDEAVSTFEYLVRQERPVKEMLYADYTFLNKPLAKFYGIDEGREAHRQAGEGGRRQRVRPRRRAASGLGADDDVGAAAHEPGQARRLDPAADSRHADAAAARRRRLDSRRRQGVRRPDAAGAARRSTSATRRAPTATCASIRSAFRSRASTRSAGLATRMPTASPSTSPASSPTRRPSSAPQGLLKYLQSQDKQVMTTLSKKMLGYALGPHGPGLGSAARSAT